MARVAAVGRTSSERIATTRDTVQATASAATRATSGAIAEHGVLGAGGRLASSAGDAASTFMGDVFVRGDLEAAGALQSGLFSAALPGAGYARATRGVPQGGARQVTIAENPVAPSVVPNAALSPGARLRAKYGHLTSDQRAARIDELAMGNRVLREAGVPRQYISEALQSFEPGTITHRIAGQDDFGLRLYGGVSGSKSPYIGPTFPLGDVRSLNAVIPGNTLQNIAQWQIRPGTPLLEGRIRANFGQPGGGQQIYVPNFHNNLLVPGGL